MLARWKGANLDADPADRFWRDSAECAWAHPGGTLVKVAVVPVDVAELLAQLPPDGRARIIAGGNMAWVSLPAGRPIPAQTSPGMLLRGAGPLWPGAAKPFEIHRAMKVALDPDNRFPRIDE
jgi:hypothetical protein